MVPYFLKFKIFSLKRKRRVSSKKQPTEVNWEEASDIHRQLKQIITTLSLTHINIERIRTFRSYGSKAYARARIWSFPRIWQQALNLPAYYIIEVLSERFDHLSLDDKKRVLIHELMHIPKSFSGSLVAHRGRYHTINSRTVEKLFNMYKSQEH